MTNCALPEKDCNLCPRLARFREENRVTFPGKYNAPVPPFGHSDARLYIVGLAPGLRGANFTGRPFTGDYAGDLLYSTLIAFGFAQGTYRADPQDGLTLVDCRITNAVKCVPPENKPVSSEIRACNSFLAGELAAAENLSVIVALGRIAHEATLKATGVKARYYPFAHGAEHPLPGGRLLIDSFHCSRYNTQTRRLTEEMFHDIFRQARRILPA
ncbi:MAG: uracil-DNA glycosylase [Alphaproteobacteria bacterium]|nr:uracil-DNA glycosylase [Alphaproteobacteria bacterium]